MTAIQHGWERGRSVFDLPGDAAPAVEKGDPAAGPGLAGDGGIPENTGIGEGITTTQGTGIPGVILGTPAGAPVSAAVPTRDAGVTGLQAGEASSDSGGTSG